MQSSPLGQSLFCLQAGLASAALAQTPADVQTLMRASMRMQSLLLEQVYSQKPPTHVWGEPPLQSAVVLQFGEGRVSTTHAPWLQ
jgi:hypothetical protein